MIRLICMAALLTGCAHSAQLKADDIDDIKGGKSGAVILDLKMENMGCQDTTITLREKTSGAIVSINHASSWKKDSLPFAIKALPAGDYAFYEGGCVSSYKSGDYQYTDTHSFPLFGDVFSSIKVEVGDITYPGTLRLRKDKDEYVSYAAEDTGAAIQSALNNSSPELADRYKTYPIRTVKNMAPMPIITQTRYHYVAPVKPITPGTPPNKK